MGNATCCYKGSNNGSNNNKEIVLLLLGLDNAGKTVTAKTLARETIDAVVPTVGFSVANLRYGKYNVHIYDLGGRNDFRGVWDRYYVDAHGIIFVVDSSDYNRLEENEYILKQILTHDKVHGKPLLVLANKQDHENALDEIDIIEKLQLETLVNENECPTLVESCSANDSNNCKTNKQKLDPGIKRGYTWLLNYIIRDHKALDERVRKDTKLQRDLEEKERQAKIERLNRQSSERIAVEPTRNGVVHIIRNDRDKHGDSDSSFSADSPTRISYGTIQQEITTVQPRPKSATNAVRRQLELDGERKNMPTRPFRSIKTAPVHLYDRGTERTGRRGLKSAGDSVFVVGDGSGKFSLPAENGSGDLFVVRRTRGHFLPPIDVEPKPEYF